MPTVPGQFGDLTLDEILLFVETGDAQRLATLRRRLSAQPDVLARLEAMRADRKALHDLPEPALREDLVTPLVARIERPLLLEAPVVPRRRRPTPWRRLALAAGIVLAVGASSFATWVWITSGDGPTPPSDAQGPALAQASPPPAESGRVEDDPDRLLPEGYYANWKDFGLAAAGNSAGPDERAATADRLPLRRLAGERTIVDAGVLLRVAASDEEALLASLRDRIDALDSSATLDRTFTYAQAEAAWRAAAGRLDRGGGTLAASDLRPGAPGGDRNHRDAVRRLQRASENRLGGHLAGDRRAAPPAEDLLGFGEIGADCTIVLPSAEVERFLDAAFEAGSLDLIETAGISGKWDGVPANAGDFDRWRTWSRFRAALAAVREASAGSARDEPLVVLPLAIEAPGE